MELQKPPVYEKSDSFGMQGWFQKIWYAIARKCNLINITTSYTVAEDIFYVRANATGGAVTVTLPSSLGKEGREILVVKTDAGANVVTVTCSGSDTIQGSSTFALSTQWDKALFIDNGVNGWERLTSTIATTVVVGNFLTNSLGADVAMNNTANYFDGPSVAQGTTGTWLVTGNVVVKDTAGAADIQVKLWDGTTVIDSAYAGPDVAGRNITISLSGVIASPAGNLRISAKDVTSTSGVIVFNKSANSKDSTITAVRIV